MEEIGRGGMGTVHKAFDPSLSREVAIKLLHEDLAHDPKFVTDFLREARNGAAISHANIVQVLFVGEEEGQYYIAMELLKGQTLREVIEKEGPLPEERTLDIAIDIVKGLRAAYRSEMIHGDIKPANIFLTNEGIAKILDFGLAKLANVEVNTSEDGVWGSPYYISPERVGQKAEDFRSDVYSLGATLFHVLIGRPPFNAQSAENLAVMRLNEKPPLLRDFNPEITQKTEQVINKMLSKSILLRYRNYEALLTDLNEAKTEATAKRLGVTIDRKTGVYDHTESKKEKKSSWVPLLITVGVVLLINGLFFSIITSPKTSWAGKLLGKIKSSAYPVYSASFRLQAPDAKNVSLIGEFNDWNPSATPMKLTDSGYWETTLELRPGAYDYKFLVDGKQTVDSENRLRTEDENGEVCSVIVVGKY